MKMVKILLLLGSFSLLGYFYFTSHTERTKKISGTVRLPSCTWDYSYELVYSKTANLVLRLSFNGEDVNEEYVKYAVEEIWNNKYCVMDKKSGRRMPCTLTIIFDSENPDQVVKISKHGVRTHMLRWRLDDLHPGIMAHEIGHMLGLTDEYEGGAVRLAPVYSDSGIMGKGAVNGRHEMKWRYYWPWLIDEDMIIVPASNESN